MNGRRMFLGAALSATSLVLMRRAGSAQTADKQAQEGDNGGLPDRGAPTGRTGAATRNIDKNRSELTLDLAAPQHGIGLTTVAQPELCYLVSGRVARPLRLVISVPNRPQPLARVNLAEGSSPGFQVLRLHDHNIRLPENLLCVWSVVIALDPGRPSHDLVASALIRYRPADPTLPTAGAPADTQSRIASLVRAGYWYDAFTIAEKARVIDHGTALASLFKQADLHVGSG